VKVNEVSHNEFQRDKRDSRAEDQRRLDLHLVSPEQLEEENSLVPMNAKFTVLNFCEMIEKHYGE
jgi:hypothetical protein